MLAIILLLTVLVWIWALTCYREVVMPTATATITDRLRQYGPAVDLRLGPVCRTVGLDWPPQELAFLAFKDRRIVELYGRSGPDAAWRWIRNYEIQGASGRPGPKLQEGDRQVPEGLYRAESLNPNSAFHLSIRVGYPNAFDRRMARLDGRTQLGGDIMIHGGSASIGCLAMGDEAAEDLFVAVARCGLDQVLIIIAPADFRQACAIQPRQGPTWLPTLYQQIRAALQPFPLPVGKIGRPGQSD